MIGWLMERGGSDPFPPDLFPSAAAKCERGTRTREVTRVLDGDTIEVGGLPIRLSGIAAPERNEPGGAEATAGMPALVSGRDLRQALGEDRPPALRTGAAEPTDSHPQLDDASLTLKRRSTMARTSPPPRPATMP